MTEMIIEKDVVIDDVESVLYAIKNLSSKHVSDIGVIKKFINNEKNTKIYVDRNLNSYMTPMSECVYVWLDTGYIDYRGNPIFISLVKSWDKFIGHVVGTISMLCDSACRFFHLNKSKVQSKIDAIRRKWDEKSEQRIIHHIEDEMDYLVAVCNGHDECETIFAQKLRGLEIVLENDDVECDTEECEEAEIPDFTVEENEITVSILLEKMNEMQAYMDELVRMLDEVSTDASEKIKALQDKNNEYKRAIVQMRMYNSEQRARYDNVTDISAHSLLGKHKKILVIGGQELGINVMQGIAKTVGFENDDFEYMDYDKAKSQMGRIQTDGRYRAVIYGACPHKTTGNAGYSSSLEKMQQESGMPFTTDARNKSGKLKVTKESFKTALLDVYEDMKLAYAV